MNWISVKDRLPEAYKIVMIYTPGFISSIPSDNMFSAFLTDWEEWRATWTEDYTFDKKHVKYWCKPDPPGDPK